MAYLLGYSGGYSDREGGGRKPRAKVSDNPRSAVVGRTRIEVDEPTRATARPRNRVVTSDR